MPPTTNESQTRSTPDCRPRTNVVVVEHDEVLRTLMAGAVTTAIADARVDACTPDSPDAAAWLRACSLAVCSCAGEAGGRMDGLRAAVVGTPERAARVVLVPADSPGLLDEAIDCGATHAVLQVGGWMDQLGIVARQALRPAPRAPAQTGRAADLAATLAEIRGENDTLRGLVERLEGMAATDPLTGLGNRRAMETRLEELFSASERHGFELSCLAADVDGLKTVNDALGHAAGDGVIQAAARVLRETCRRADVLCRVGGDEFVVLLPHTDLPRARLVAERLRSRFEEATAPVRDRLAAAGTGFRVVRPHRRGSGGAAVPGLSVGVATRIAERTPDGPALVAEADAALYSAKHAGRGRVVVTAAASRQRAGAAKAA